MTNFSPSDIERRKTLLERKAEQDRQIQARLVYERPRIRLRYVRLNQNALVPTKGDLFAACYDLSCPKGTKIDVAFGQKEPIVIPTGLAIEVPRGYHVKIYPRSSMPLRYCATLANCTAIIDNGYLNEWKLLVLPFNWSATDCDYFKKACEEGVALAQFEMVENGLDLDFDEVANFGDSYDRGGGFGSTGK